MSWMDAGNRAIAKHVERGPKVPCTNCRSTGWVTDSGSLGGESPCPKCDGRGEVDK